MNLTPEQLAELQRLFSTPVGGGLDNAYMPNTVDYGGQSWKRDDAGGFAAMGPLYGDNQYKYTNYDTGGAQTAEGDARLSDWDPLTGFLLSTGALIGGGLAFGGPSAFGFGGAAGGPGSAGWGMGLDSVTGGSGALEAMGGGTSAMGAGAGLDASLLNGLNGSDIMSDAFVSNGAYGGGGFGGTSGGWWDNLINGRGGNGLSGLLGDGPSGSATTAAGAAATAGAAKNPILGLGMSLLGGALGSQGIDKSVSEEEDIPEWLKPNIMKQLGYAGGLLDKQMAPGYMQGYDQMRSMGANLMNQPIAGNGFAQFQAMPRFGR